MSARPADPCRVPLLRRERAVLMARFNQRVNPHKRPFSELRHKIYLGRVHFPVTGAKENAAPAERGGV
jgi:hypothetical protein